MKRLYVFVFFVFFLIGCDGLSDAISQYDKVQYIEPTVLYYANTLEGLQEKSYNIVKGRLGDDSSTVTALLGRGMPTPVYSIVSLDVVEVIKGDLKGGQEIKIIEPYYISNRILWTMGNYLPSKANQEYIFFLDYPIDESEGAPEGCVGAYFVLHEERGRYLVPSADRSLADGFTREELSLGEKNTDLYMTLYNEVINTYLR